MFLEKEQVIILLSAKYIHLLNIPPLPNKKQKDKQYFKKRTFYI